MWERDIDPDLLSAKPLNDPVENVVQERTVETAQTNLAEMAALLTPAGEQRVEEIVKNKDNLIEALSLILDIYENNPLIINKFIVAQEEDLTRLLFLLTGAEQIELNKTDPETGCTCKASKFTYINKIMVKKGGNTYNFKYSFPNVIALLDNRRISWRIVC